MNTKHILASLLLLSASSCRMPVEDPKVVVKEGASVSPMGDPNPHVNPPTTDEPDVPHTLTAKPYVCCIELDHHLMMVGVPCEVDFPVSYHPISSSTVLDSAIVRDIDASAPMPFGGMAMLINSTRMADSSISVVSLSPTGSLISSHRVSMAGYQLTGGGIQTYPDGSMIVAGVAENSMASRTYFQHLDTDGHILNSATLTSPEARKVLGVFNTPDGNQIVAFQGKGTGSPCWNETLLLSLIDSSGTFDTTIAPAGCLGKSHMIGFEATDGSPAFAWADGEKLKTLTLSGSFPVLSDDIHSYHVGPDLILRSAIAAPDGSMFVGGKARGSGFILHIPASGIPVIKYPPLELAGAWVESIGVDCDRFVAVIVYPIQGRTQTMVWTQQLE